MRLRIKPSAAAADPFLSAYSSARQRWCWFFCWLTYCRLLSICLKPWMRHCRNQLPSWVGNQSNADGGLAKAGAGCRGCAAAVLPAHGSAKGGACQDYLKTILPLTGRINQKRGLAMMAKTLALLLNSGIDLLTALNRLTGVTENRYLKKKCSSWLKNCRGQESGAEIKGECGLPGLFCQLVRVGESAGSLADCAGICLPDLQRWGAKPHPLLSTVPWTALFLDCFRRRGALHSGSGDAVGFWYFMLRMPVCRKSKAKQIRGWFRSKHRSSWSNLQKLDFCSIMLPVPSYSIWSLFTNIA